jgi:hypothetical protein
MQKSIKEAIKQTLASTLRTKCNSNVAQSQHRGILRISGNKFKTQEKRAKEEKRVTTSQRRQKNRFARTEKQQLSAKPIINNMRQHIIRSGVCRHMNSHMLRGQYPRDTPSRSLQTSSVGRCNRSARQNRNSFISNKSKDDETPWFHVQYGSEDAGPSL